MTVRTCNKTNMRKWVAALRSGNFEQTRRYLSVLVQSADRADEPQSWRHCCMGVVCQVAIADGVSIKTEVGELTDEEVEEFTNELDKPYPRTFGIMIYDGLTGYLPSAVLRWLGIEGIVSSDPWLDLPGADGVPTGVQEMASALNDGRGWGFDQIADAIEVTFGLNEPDEEETDAEQGQPA